MTAGARAATLLLVAALVAAGCGVGARADNPVTFPPQTFGPAGTPTPAIVQARAAVTAALGQAGLLVEEPQQAYRPAEVPELAAAPRSVIRAVLPEDPAGGLVSIYGFRDPQTATAAADAQAAYVASPVGRVQFPTGTQFTIRQFGSAVVFHAAVPGGSPDAQAPDVVEALRTVGSEVTVPG